jgi:hypothetical protein
MRLICVCVYWEIREDSSFAHRRAKSVLIKLQDYGQREVGTMLTLLTALKLKVPAALALRISTSARCTSGSIGQIGRSLKSPSSAQRCASVQ